MIFLDANMFLRALTRSPDPAIQRMNRIAGDLFREAERGDVDVTTSEAVIAEVAYVLTSKAHYRLAVEDAAGRLAAMLRPSGVKIRVKRVVLHALDLWADNPALGFVDALTAIHARQPGVELATFDTDFDTIPGITRWRPDGDVAPGG